MSTAGSLCHKLIPNRDVQLLENIYVTSRPTSATCCKCTNYNQTKVQSEFSGVVDSPSSAQPRLIVCGAGADPASNYIDKRGRQFSGWRHLLARTTSLYMCAFNFSKEVTRLWLSRVDLRRRAFLTLYRHNRLVSVAFF